MSGLGWLSYPYYTPTEVMISVPGSAGFGPTMMPTAETSLQNAASQYINDSEQFTEPYNTPEYQNPAAFTANMIDYARTLCYGAGAAYTCVGFEPVTMGTKYANLVISTLKQIPLNRNDPSTGSVYAAWIAKPPAVTPDYTPPAPVQPFNPSSLPPAIVATLPAAARNYVPPVAPAPTPSSPSVAPVPMPPVSAPPVQNWFPPIGGGSSSSGAPGGFSLSFLTNPISLFGYSVPLWMLLAGGVGTVFVAGSVGGRR